jgi:hypothetical protein
MGLTAEIKRNYQRDPRLAGCSSEAARGSRNREFQYHENPSTARRNFNSRTVNQIREPSLPSAI